MRETVVKGAIGNVGEVHLTGEYGINFERWAGLGVNGGCDEENDYCDFKHYETNNNSDILIIIYEVVQFQDYGGRVSPFRGHFNSKCCLVLWVEYG